LAFLEQSLDDAVHADLKVFVKPNPVMWLIILSLLAFGKSRLRQTSMDMSVQRFSYGFRHRENSNFKSPSSIT
jgi:hypothetical protein